MEFGKLCSWEKQGNRVVFQFEKRTGRVEILTPEIFNVFSGVVKSIALRPLRETSLLQLILRRQKQTVQ